MANVGYLRVSTLDQKTDRQLDGLELDKVFEEKASAATTARPVLKQCLDYLREKDTLHVHSIDRLARNLGDLLALLTSLTEKGVAVTFHKENLSFSGDTANPFHTLQLQIIGAVAQFERAIIRERQREGIAKAQAKGKHCGRKSKLSDRQEQELRGRVESGAEKKALAAEYGISRQTLYRILAQA